MDKDMEPVVILDIWNTNPEILEINLPDGVWKLYSVEQLATLQAKLEQAEKDKAELLDTLKASAVVLDAHPDDGLTILVHGVIAKYGSKSS